MDERLVSTYKLAFKTGGKYKSTSEISSTVEMNRCITLENLYTTGNELDINVNESLSGEKIKGNDYMNKSEENLIKLRKQIDIFGYF